MATCQKRIFFPKYPLSFKMTEYTQYEALPYHRHLLKETGMRFIAYQILSEPVTPSAYFLYKDRS